jgi:hypothetical protein
MRRSAGWYERGSTNRLTAARDFTAAGHTERAATLRAEAAVLSDLLGDV